MNYNLSMTFLTESMETSTFTISDVRADITTEEVLELMDAIIENNVFRNKKGDFLEKEGAKLVQSNSTKFEI